jgi:hypothetical protein
MVEPLTAAGLGGLALDRAQSAISKWVTTQLTTSVEVALRNKVLEQGLPAKYQQEELSAVLAALSCQLVSSPSSTTSTSGFSSDTHPALTREKKRASRSLPGDPVRRSTIGDRVPSRDQRS